MKKYEAPSMKQLELDVNDVVTSSVVNWVNEGGNIVTTDPSGSTEIELPGDWTTP
ncbi:MAG TPA: hypothetical protein P5116_02630 [Eubacteriales bacterium]|nr:hypothetical protein [Clostridia bacterium]HRV72760.1 hypothetical protein [Eubacteriales bacterium]